MTAWVGDGGMVLSVPVVVLAAVDSARWMARQPPVWRVDQEIDLEACRTAKGPVPLH